MHLPISKVSVLTFEEYLSKLNGSINLKNSKKNLNLILDGEPSRIFRDNVSLEFRRQHGAFFTNKKLASTLFKMSERYVSRNSRVIDPTCGIGDLLIPFASKMASGKNVTTTISLWNDQIFGCDINPILIEATKIRLFFLAKLLNGSINTFPNFRINDHFSNILVKDFFELDLKFERTDVIVCNPPFGSIQSNKQYSYGNGKMQRAAIFMHRLVENITTGQNIFAILPDVLRSGSRYEKWRNSITEIADVVQIKRYGRFDKYTDVDVFLIHFQKKKNKNVYSVKWVPTSSKESLGKHFDICVGPVVPFRLKNTGDKFIYVNTKNALPWKGIKNLSKRIKFNGKYHKAPFVVVRRTSGPNDNYRAVPTLINARGKFVVENHLFVLTPKDGSVKKCKLLIKNLKNQRTNKWLNEYIRCRHLTKKSLLELPWWSNE